MAAGKGRLWIWGALAAATLLAVVLLIVAKNAQDRRRGSGTEAAAPAGPVTLRVRDGDGDVVEGAQAYVSGSSDAPLAPAGGWDAEAGVLTLEGGTPARRVVLQARGYRTVVLEDVAADRDLVLEPGLVLRLRVVGDPVLPGPPYRLYFQVKPDAESWTGMSESQRQVLVDLMEATTAPPEGMPETTRRGFGFEVSRTQAEAGLRVPLPGRYAIRWGLFDTDRGMWYSRRAGTTTVVDVPADGRPITADIEMTTEEVEATKAELDGIGR
jgi:hypothetical protein